MAEEAFMEDINNMLSSGEVPNLFKPDEFEEIFNSIIDQAKKEGVDESSQVSPASLLISGECQRLWGCTD